MSGTPPARRPGVIAGPARPRGAWLDLATSWGADEPLDPPRSAFPHRPPPVEPEGRPDDLFARYPPPFDLTSDMLFVVALAPAAPLRRSFPSAPFLSLGGRVPLVAWLSRVTRGRAGDGRVEGDGRAPLYHELSLVALLRRPAFFVPGIYATSRRSLRLGWRYGMPKAPIAMSFDDAGGIASALRHAGRASAVRATPLAGGWLVGAAARALLPSRVPPVAFPGGERVQPAILDLPAARPVRVAGWLALDEAWLPRPIRLLPLGLYAPGLRMLLPPPDSSRASSAASPV